jgi:predicted metalloendopeptidase
MSSRSVFASAALAVVVVVGLAAQTPLKSGLDPATFDKAVRPQDDLFRHVNGGWLTKTEIPSDRPVYGTFIQLDEKAEANLYALIEELAGNRDKKPGSTAQQVGDYYAGFMDEAALNKLGADPLKPRLADVDAIADTKALAEALGRLSVIGLPGPIGGYIEADAGDPTQMALYLFQGGTALPDRDYYLKDDAKFADVRAKYVDYLTKVFTLAGRPNAAADAKTVLALETEFAKIQWTQVESRDAVKTYNKYPVQKVVDEMPGFDWLVWARPQGIDKASEWVISQPSFFKSFAAMVPKTPLATWKAWMAAQVITMNASYLSKPFDEARFEFFSKTLSGQQQQRQRWKRGVQLVNSSMGEALGQLYVQKFFPAASKARMEKMIANLLEAYRQSISNLDWMTPDTRKEALAKLAKFSPKIAYPSKWRDYSKLQVKADDLVGTVERANRLETEYQVAKLGKPVDREEWLMTPQTVNAYYNPVKNEIVFPAAVLQPPFFDLGADDAVNYGAIGAVIGHEIGHGFDDQGRRFDGDGKLRDWWKPEDEAEFQKRAKLLVEQFNGFSPAPGLKINGELTLGENIGDLGGLSIAYQAYRLSLAGRPAPVIDGYTGDQRFFMGWAQVWAGKMRDDARRQQVIVDPHSPEMFRANAPVRNVPEFYDAFGVKDGDQMFLAPAQRAKIW